MGLLHLVTPIAKFSSLPLIQSKLKLCSYLVVSVILEHLAIIAQSQINLRNHFCLRIA